MTIRRHIFLNCMQNPKHPWKMKNPENRASLHLDTKCLIFSNHFSCFCTRPNHTAIAKHPLKPLKKIGILENRVYPFRYQMPVFYNHFSCLLHSPKSYCYLVTVSSQSGPLSKRRARYVHGTSLLSVQYIFHNHRQLISSTHYKYV